MNQSLSASLVVLVAAVLCAPSATAQVGSCEPATGEALLDVGNVRARILNNGALFWRGGAAVYEVPKGGGVSPIFASGVWVGGLVDGELRVAAAQYARWEFWAGPLDDAGNPPGDCSQFDKVWEISVADLATYEADGKATDDLATWPSGLGAPTLAPATDDGVDNDGDGRTDEPDEMKNITTEILALPLAQRVDRVIDLAAGERPALVGHQMLWWIMNDRGNIHESSDTPPIGLEVHASAFAYNVSGAVGNSTFYKLDLYYRGAERLDSAYVSLFSDPDLGNAFDDSFGSDTTLGMAYVYNADNFDNEPGYGDAPPAVGYDVLRGPIVPSVDGTTFDTLDVSSIVSPDKHWGTPSDGFEIYNVMQGLTSSGKPLREFGDGYQLPEPTTAPITKFKFPGDPVTGQFWSAVNMNDEGSPYPGRDVRLVVSVGPFSMEPGGHQELVYAIVWARGTDNIDSITELRVADRVAQTLADSEFRPVTLPAAPDVELVALDGQVDIAWDNDQASNNYLESYREKDLFADSEVASDYVFEGYEIFRFASDQDAEGELIAVYDVENGVTTVIEDVDGDGLTAQTAYGSDTGIQHSHRVSGLTNYTTYHFGVRAYAHSESSSQHIIHSSFARAAVIPARSSSLISEAASEAEANREEPDFVAHRITGTGNGLVTADIVNAALVRDCEYRVMFFSVPDGETSYSILCGAETLFDGSTSGEPAPQRSNVFVVDGLEFSVVEREPGFSRFLVTANAAGPLDPPEMGVFAFDDSGFPTLDGLPANGTNDRPSDNQQVGAGRWVIHAGGASDGTIATYMQRSLLSRSQGLSNLGLYDYEIRFTTDCAATLDGTTGPDDCLAWLAFQENDAEMEVPFELWRIGVSTPDDPGDDVRLIPVVADVGVAGAFDLEDDHPVDEGDDDPATDWIYAYLPRDTSPGESGYNCFFADTCDVGDEIIGRQVLVNLNGGEGPYNQDLPEPGTVFRYVTNKPFQPGDVFAFSTGQYAAREPTLDEQKERLADIGITPNPYLGASAYETSKLNDEVRFTNLPDVATIRVFTLNGRLLRTIRKDSPATPSYSWDLTTDEGLPLGSGMYLIHVEAPGLGEEVLKFGVVKWEVDYGNTTRVGEF